MRRMNATDSTDQTTSRPQLRRSRTDRVIFGVAGGLAHRFGLSATAVRILFVLSAIFVVGAVFYLAAAFALRAEGDERPSSRGRMTVAGVACLATLALAQALGVTYPNVGVLAILALLASGIVVILGRRPGSHQEAVSTGAPPLAGMPRLQPPVLLLLTLAVVGVAATATWLVVRSASGVEGIGAVASVSLVAVGLGLVLGAWRGRSVLLLPVGLALALPLGLASFAGARVELGSDDPGTLRAGAAERTYVLGRGARPVIVTAAVGKDLRRLTIRKAAGVIDVRIAPEVPVRVTFASIRGEFYSDLRDGYYIQAWGWGTGSRTFRLPATGTRRQNGEPLEVRVETATASVSFGHNATDVARPVPDTFPAQRANVRIDIAARTKLLRRERATLSRLQTRYTRALGSIASASVAVSPRVLDVDESRWLEGDASTSTWLRLRDPALASAGGLETLRFDLLRAAWRTNAVQRGIREQEKLLAALDAAGPTRARVAKPTPHAPRLGSGPSRPPSALRSKPARPVTPGTERP